MTNPYTPEKVAELVALAGSTLPVSKDAGIIDRLARALTAVAAERDEALAIAENGSCWDAGPQIRTPGGCDPIPPKCELRAGHAGAHRRGKAEWMRNPSSYNQVAADRDRLHKAITEALESEETTHQALCGRSPGQGDSSQTWRILRAALDKEGQADE